jgi:hypothetical protein
MYASLKSADGTFPAEDGGTWFVQKDERSASEVEADHDYSTLFALVRVLNPLRMAKPASRPRLQYVVSEMSPEPVREAVASGHGHLIHSSQVIPYAGIPRSPEDLVEYSLAKIARRVGAERNLQPTITDLTTLEKTFNVSQSGDEAQYWRAVLALGAFGGETLRSLAGGRWVRRDEAGVIPFAFACTVENEPTELYLLAKAMKFFDNGPEDSLTSVIRFAQRQSQPPRKSFWAKLFG